MHRIAASWTQLTFSPPFMPIHPGIASERCENAARKGSRGDIFTKLATRERRSNVPDITTRVLPSLSQTFFTLLHFPDSVFTTSSTPFVSYPLLAATTTFCRVMQRALKEQKNRQRTRNKEKGGNRLSHSSKEKVQTSTMPIHTASFFLRVMFAALAKASRLHTRQGRERLGYLGIMGLDESFLVFRLCSLRSEGN